MKIRTHSDGYTLRWREMLLVRIRHHHLDHGPGQQIGPQGIAVQALRSPACDIFSIMTTDEKIATEISADPWLLHCASGVKNGTIGTLPWRSWWYLASFADDVIHRFRQAYPSDLLPTKPDVERVLLTLI